MVGQPSFFRDFLRPEAIVSVVAGMRIEIVLPFSFIGVLHPVVT
jgi:hypothetical protein